jgi:hypothetical protein
MVYSWYTVTPEAIGVRASLIIGGPVLVALAGALFMVNAAWAGAVTVDTLPGQGWMRQGANTPGGHVRLVEGPQTPPEGRGSL